MICPVCNGNGFNKTEILDSYRSANEKWVECSDCKSWYFFNDYSIEKEIISNKTITNNIKWENDNYIKKIYFNEFLISIIKTLEPINSRILDIGCSFGAFLRIAKQNGFEVYGYDIIPELKDVLNKYEIASCINEDIRNCNFENIGTVTVIDTNYLWENQKSELYKLSEILSVKGILIIRTTSRLLLLKTGLILRKINKKLAKKLIYKSILNHRFVCKYSDIKNTLDKLNFRIISISAEKSSTGKSFINSILNKIFDIIYSITGKQYSLNALIIAIKE